MTLYVDSSALLKRYVDEHDSVLAVDLMSADPVLVTSRLTEIEVRRNLARLLDANDLRDARRQVAVDLDLVVRTLGYRQAAVEAVLVGLISAHFVISGCQAVCRAILRGYIIER